MVEVYHWEPNANSGKPIITLYEKGIEFTSHYTDLLNFDQHKPEYLKINPNGTIPILLHDGRMLAESTEMGEYIDSVFPGLSLRPEDPVERWRMRWWGKFMDGYFGPSLSMIGWNIFIGPAVRDKDPEELKQAIARIPLKERRDAWSMAIYNKFPEEQLTESRRRVEFGARFIEQELGKRPWFAGNSYSLADINAFCMLYALPMSQPEIANKELTPNLMAWLSKVYVRPAIEKSFALGKTHLAERAREFVNTLKQ